MITAIIVLGLAFGIVIAFVQSYEIDHLVNIFGRVEDLDRGIIDECNKTILWY